MALKTVRRVMAAAVMLTLTFFFTIALFALGQPSVVMAYETATDFRYPLNSGGWFLGQGFGIWNSSRSAYHLAEDLLPSNRITELPVYAPANGQVKVSGYQSGVYGYGHIVVIEHRLPDNTYLCSVLGHLKAAKLIPRGTDVVKGQLIGYISADPKENGGYNFAHLHFGIRSGPYSTTRDPDGGWRYRGYAAGTAIKALWHHPSEFVKAHNAPAPVKEIGSLCVTISPQGAINAGAQWRIVGTSTWFNSGYTQSGVPTGSYTVEYKAVSGWDKPANRSVTISNGN
ncbi:MAG: peptidoglycan DD-metalloendopeptidase family protein, partial [Bacillota bacterium]